MRGKLDREKCLSHIRDQELKQSMMRLLDLWERAFFRHRTEVTDFYDPYIQQMAMDILRGLPEMSFAPFGGYEEAERKRIAIIPGEASAGNEDFKLAYLQVEGHFKFREVSHRDYLGSLLSLGLGREKIGDLLVGEKGCQVILEQDILSYIRLNWTQVNAVSVQVREISREDLTVPQGEKKEIKSTVASPRLDAVLSVGFASSRTKTLPEIKGGKVRVNWKTITDPAYQIKEGDHISCRGKGRIEMESISGPTQKGRFFVRIARYC